MKDLMTISLMIIVISLLLFLYFGKRHEGKITEKTDVDESPLSNANPFMESTVQEVGAQDMMAADLYSQTKK